MTVSIGGLAVELVLATCCLACEVLTFFFFDNLYIKLFLFSFSFFIFYFLVLIGILLFWSLGGHRSCNGYCRDRGC